MLSDRCRLTHSSATYSTVIRVSVQVSAGTITAALARYTLLNRRELVIYHTTIEGSWLTYTLPITGRLVVKDADTSIITAE
jgi:hypothetical protein